MALSMGRISSPSTSPTITLSAFMRRARLTRSATEISPTPSRLAGLASSATMSGCRSGTASKPSSNACSMVTIRSRGGISAASARRSVVFPEFIAPETTMFFLALTAAPRNEARSASRVPMSVRSARERSEYRCRRIDTEGRAVTAINADNRLPSGKRRSSSGRARSNRRSESPKRLAAERTRSMSSWSESAIGCISCLEPFANVAHTRSHPLISMFSISGSSIRAWSRPMPNNASSTAWASCSSSVVLSKGSHPPSEPDVRSSRCAKTCWRANSRRSSATRPAA